MKKLLAFFLIVLSLFALTAFAEETATLTAPTGFTFNTETGEYAFNMTDAKAGYYFIRIYTVVDGEDAGQYVASSKRINGGKTGEVKGQLDVSKIGWGEYHVKLITFAASGTGMKTPEPVVLTAFYGVGGTLEKPEFGVMTDGRNAEVLIDWWTKNHWDAFCYMPIIEVNIYTDAACTQLHLTDTYDMAIELETLDRGPAGAGMCIWDYSMSYYHPYVTTQSGDNGYGLLPEVNYDLPAGTYYMTIQAKSNWEDKIASSKVSDAVAFTVIDEDADGTFERQYSSLWKDPNGMGFPMVNSQGHEDRIDYGKTQVTTSMIAE